jgi:hypothetical protein
MLEQENLSIRGFGTTSISLSKLGNRPTPWCTFFYSYIEDIFFPALQANKEINFSKNLPKKSYRYS